MVDNFEQWLHKALAAGGPVTFAQFMDWALYHPQYGYYSKGPNIGPRGDFTTSPEASPAFGRLLANHVSDIDALLTHPEQFDVIECGPGLGTLARDLLDALAAQNLDLYARLHYFMVEISPALAQEQRARLLPAHANCVDWSTDLDGAPAGRVGALLANEVVDAFPVHVLENKDGDLVEHYVGASEDGGLRLAYGPPSRPELVAFLDQYDIDLLPGERVEINLAAQGWVSQVAGTMERGIAMIIDYGDTSPSRYSEARREGTLLGYYGGAVTDNLLAHPGEQDLTALVDFTALQDDAKAAGLDVVGMTRQSNFLLGLGLGTTVNVEVDERDIAATLNSRHGMQALVSPQGLGRFRVLLLGKGVDSEAARAKLSGLRYAGIGD